MITNYSSLQTAIATWLGRSDLTAQIPTFIQFAEARIWRKLRVAEMQAEASGTTTPSQRWITVPSDCVEIQTVYIVISGNNVELKPMAPDALPYRDEPTACPIGYVRVGDNLKLVGGQATTYDYSLLYFASPDPLSDTNTSNWLLLKEPAAYLYAALLETAPYLQDDPRITVWAGLFDDIMTGMKVADDNARYGHSLQQRTRGNFP